jgi:hypothetical protein
MVFPDGDNTYRVLGQAVTLFPKPGELISNTLPRCYCGKMIFWGTPAALWSRDKSRAPLICRRVE